MIPPQAIQRFAHQQKQLLRHTYDTAWQQGVDSYQPDADPEEEPDQPKTAALVGLTGLALLAARRLYKYTAPTSPDPTARAVALAPAFAGLHSMVGELATLSAQAEDLATGATADLGAAQEAYGTALLDWIESEGWRLDGGSSAAWAGEQNGFGEAASADGQLLTWQTEDDERVCADCQQLGDMPPQAMEDWPAQPGDGTTECDVGCRCSLDVSEIQVLPGDTYIPPLNDDQNALVGQLATARADALDSVLPDASYLE